MSLEERIVEWAATRPSWQRAALRRSAQGLSFSDKFFEELLVAALGGADPPDADLLLADLPHTVKGDPPTELHAIAEPEHVNALSSDSPLTFGAGGITLVYGDNGSGKSGYARLLKRVGRSRHQEEVLSDVFRDPAVARPQAQITYASGGAAATVTWPTQAPVELKRVLFYDSACGSAYLSSESDFPYRPSALSIFDGLVEACRGLRERLDTRLQANALEAKTPPGVPEELAGTEVGQFVGTLSATSSMAVLDELLEAFDKRGLDMDALRRQEAQLLTSDTSRERQRLNQQVSKLTYLLRHLESLHQELGKERFEELEGVLGELQALETAAELMARSFESEPLAGVGGSAWKELWESARRFSQVDAYPSEHYPVVRESAHCVLCQQEIGAGARSRLQRFEEFVREDTQARLREVSDNWGRTLDRLRTLTTEPEAVNAALSDLEVDFAQVVESVRIVLDGYEQRRRAVIGSNPVQSIGAATDIDSRATIEGLQAARSTARRIAEALDDPALQKIRIGAIAKDVREFELVRQVRSRRAEIEGEIERLRARETLEAAKAQSATSGITRKVVELSEESVTAVVRDRFTRETDRLLLERVTLRTRGERGALLHQPTLVGARQEVTLRRVFSEGERTALGLSGFLTEAELDESKSTVVLDDPVTSLDHVRRARVATRLAELAVSRQVVVFTHDVGFVADLKREASGLGVPVSERSVARARGPDRRPGKCSDTLPWKARDSSARLGDLRADLAALRKASASMDDDAYGEAVASLAGRLSETWERILGQEIVGQVLPEGGLEVRPNMMKVMVRLTQADGDEFQASYSRISQWARRHDKSPVINYVPPEADDIEKEIELVAAWAKRVKGYKN